MVEEFTRAIERILDLTPSLLCQQAQLRDELVRLSFHITELLSSQESTSTGHRIESSSSRHSSPGAPGSTSKSYPLTIIPFIPAKVQKSTLPKDLLLSGGEEETRAHTARVDKRSRYAGSSPSPPVIEDEASAVTWVTIATLNNHLLGELNHDFEEETKLFEHFVREIKQPQWLARVVDIVDACDSQHEQNVRALYGWCGSQWLWKRWEAFNGKKEARGKPTYRYFADEVELVHSTKFSNTMRVSRRFHQLGDWSLLFYNKMSALRLVTDEVYSRFIEELSSSDYQLYSGNLETIKEVAYKLLTSFKSTKRDWKKRPTQVQGEAFAKRIKTVHNTTSTETTTSASSTAVHTCTGNASNYSAPTQEPKTVATNYIPTSFNEFSTLDWNLAPFCQDIHSSQHLYPTTTPVEHVNLAPFCQDIFPDQYHYAANTPAEHVNLAPFCQDIFPDQYHYTANAPAEHVNLAPFCQDIFANQLESHDLVSYFPEISANQHHPRISTAMEDDNTVQIRQGIPIEQLLSSQYHTNQAAVSMSEFNTSEHILKSNQYIPDRGHPDHTFSGSINSPLAQISSSHMRNGVGFPTPVNNLSLLHIPQPAANLVG